MTPCIRRAITRLLASSHHFHHTLDSCSLKLDQWTTCIGYEAERCRASQFSSLQLRTKLGLVFTSRLPLHSIAVVFGPEGDVKSICYSTTAKLRESLYGRQSSKYYE
jgi:hypothetical protein